ncbi:phosphopentomutase [Erysipelotrichaceae bacterium]|nr:phosphopentomutase [Erysipelotrichaceae bacterium]
MAKRIFLIILDSVGIGHAKDAQAFGDENTNTLGNISKKVGLHIPNLQKMGLGNIYPLATVEKTQNPTAYYTYMEPQSVGKDSVAGHWEFMGSILKEPFNNFTAAGFPDALLKEFSEKTGRKVLANKEANGLQVIAEYAEEQKKTGGLIVYTSVDSTFQIAAHEKWVGLEALYEACEIARKLTLENPDWLVARVIARPFIGDEGKYTRTGNRHDYALKPYDRIALEALKENGLDVIALGKINDLYSGVGITRAIPTADNADGIEKLIATAKTDFTGLAYLNLVEFDSLYGHPRNPEGYRDALEYFDEQLPKIIEQMLEDDILILTADHGNDPTYHGNDHTRENVPLIVYGKNFTATGEIPKRTGFADLGATITDIFDIQFETGKSFKKDLK